MSLLPAANEILSYPTIYGPLELQQKFWCVNLFELFAALLIHSTKLLELQTTLDVQGYIYI
jgi:hypothetical protein